MARGPTLFTPRSSSAPFAFSAFRFSPSPQLFSHTPHFPRLPILRAPPFPDITVGWKPIFSTPIPTSRPSTDPATVPRIAVFPPPIPRPDHPSNKTKSQKHGICCHLPISRSHPAHGFLTNSLKTRLLHKSPHLPNPETPSTKNCKNSGRECCKCKNRQICPSFLHQNDAAAPPGTAAPILFLSPSYVFKSYVLSLHLHTDFNACTFSDSNRTGPSVATIRAGLLPGVCLR